MRCKEVINILLDGKAEQVTSEKVQKHIAQCTRCRKLARVITEVEQNGKNVFERMGMSEIFVHRVHQMAVKELAGRDISSKRYFWLPLFAKAAVTLIAVGIVAWLLLHYGKTREISREESILLDHRIKNMCFMVAWRIAEIKQKFTEIRDNEQSFDYQVENVRVRIVWNRSLIERELNFFDSEDSNGAG